MKKNYIYCYLDQPSGRQQLNKVFPENKKLKNYIVKYFTTENMNFSKKDILDYYKETPKKDIPRNMLHINNLSQFENFLKTISKNDLVFIRERSFTQNKGKDYDLKLFKKYKVNTIFFAYEPWFKCNFRKDFLLNICRFIWKLINSFRINFFNNNYEPTYYVGSGELEKKTFKKKNWKKTKYIDCPSIWIDFSKNIKKKYIVYIDENIYFSRDQYLFNRNYRKTSNPELFLSDLLKFFKIIEKQYNKKIIICCSNKYEYKKNIFEGRRMTYGKTLELISKSKLVIGHRSDSLYQAISSNTPVLLLKHKTFSPKRNLFIRFRSITQFNKKSNYIEDYIKQKCKPDLSIDKLFYKKNLRNYFLTSNIKKENFSKFFFKEIDKIST